ncbi:MAG: Hsp20/alpha crystallin family protein [Syntrophaceae bacterium]|nr:Hsp20/alpha crystallin family protein [Deltaproteobacteria bacterium]
MSVKKSSPYRDILSFQDRMNRLFEETLLDASNPGRPGQWMPHVDIFEDDGSVTLKVELPGVKREDVVLDVTDRVLTISGRKVIEHENSSESFHVMERRFGSFQRSFTLPEDVSIEGIEARYEAGILEVVLPKTQSASVRKVPIIVG